MRAISGALFAALALGACSAPAAAPERSVPRQSLAPSMADAFADTAAACVVRRDTSHPVFHGCIDWHSSVHGVWALLGHARLTGRADHRALVETVLDKEGLARELEDVAASPDFEMPYGRAWFLRLADEWRAGGGDDRLDALADRISRSMVAHYRKHPPSPRARDYGNPSWALINLLRHARTTKDAATEAFVVDLVRTRFTAASERCTPDDESQGFMSVCVTWAWLALEALPRAEFDVWFAGWDPGLARLDPVRPRSAHDYGRNFSRAWGLKALADATGDEALAAAYERHLEVGYADWRVARDDYWAVGHWVAQFGMLALDPRPVGER